MKEFKHPWDIKHSISKSKTTKEEFDELVKKATKKMDKPRQTQPKQSTPYQIIGGIPHKVVNGKWVPLTKM